MNKPRLPGILLIEDNPISREFIYEALLPLSIPIDKAGTLSAASSLASKNRYGLFLCDVHLPDAGPGEILRSLKHLQDNATMIAITAETGPDVKHTLLNLGYLEVWDKPITMAALQNNVARLLQIVRTADRHEDEAVLWDEASALRAVGNNEATLKALRAMFLAELPKNINTIEHACKLNDYPKLKAECHKLLAGCGFVGAARLSHAVRQLSENPKNMEHLHALRKQAESCLGRL